jgi:hypothetical protein
MLFADKISIEHIVDSVNNNIEIKKLVLLTDRKSVLDIFQDSSKIKTCRAHLATVKPDFSIFEDSELVIVATEDDDIALPYIQYLIAQKIKFKPVWVSNPHGYISGNSIAKKVLETEYERQKREGFDKWDCGPWDFVNLIQALEATADVPGCYVEVGCFNGSSSCAVLQYAKETNIKCDFYFFDVFEGFDYEEAINSADQIWAGTHATDGIDVVSHRISKLKYRSDCTCVVKKLNIISDQLPSDVLSKGIRVANLDVDLYEATYSVILPFLMVGKSRIYATMASRCFGVNPPKAILGLS